jgi:hypothetical protein
LHLWVELAKLYSNYEQDFYNESKNNFIDKVKSIYFKESDKHFIVEHNIKEPLIKPYALHHIYSESKGVLKLSFPKSDDFESFIKKYYKNNDILSIEINYFSGKSDHYDNVIFVSNPWESIISCETKKLKDELRWQRSLFYYAIILIILIFGIIWFIKRKKN